MMTKTYKYWFYYLDGELYAYTDKKEYAKIFEEERDMTKFTKRKEEITREELNFLAKVRNLKNIIKRNLNLQFWKK